MKPFTVKFTEKSLTGNAGLVQIGRFIKKLGLQQLLERHLTIRRGANANYTPGDAVIKVIMGVLARARHISDLKILSVDPVIRTLFEWTRFPDNRTFGRIFRLFTAAHCNELSEVEAQARKKVWGKKWFGRATFDMDSAVRGVTGSQEGAEKGYNPKKKGQKSYHPLLCFVAETRECFHNWFRCGSAYSANGSVEFMKECFARLPKRVWKVFVRADSAYFDGKLLDFLEERRSEYLIKVKRKNLVSLLMRQPWRKARNKPGIETTEFMYRCQGWKVARRFVAIRVLVENETENVLFPMPRYEFFCYVTNLKLTPWETHKCYGKRATCENWIEWCKNQMASGSMLTQDFWANSALFQSCIFAYNLLVWMLWLHSKKGFHQEPNTIRFWLIHIPGRLIRSGRRWILKLPEDYLFKKEWVHIERSISALCSS